MNKPLLSIAIPTYNRANILDKSLSILIPQLIPFSDKVELIISDNCSTDDTQLIIAKYQQKKGDIQFVSYLQKENTGYFGNFRKCKELSNGVYIWLLSDNEHLEKDLLYFIVSKISELKTNVGAFYLKNLDIITDTMYKNAYLSFITNFDNLIEDFSAWRLTGISSVILLNNKRYDNIVINELHGNLFLGFIFLINSLRINKSILLIEGKLFTSTSCNVYFDVFKAWTVDITDCIKYMLKCNVVSIGQVSKFVTGYLKGNLETHVFNYCLFGIVAGRKYNSKEEVKSLLDSYYSDNIYYQDKIHKLFGYSKKLLYLIYIISKVKKRFKKMFV